MPNSKSNTSITEEEIQTLKTRFQEAKDFREQYEKSWDKAILYYEGGQWEGQSKIAWYQSEPVYNKVAEFVEIMRGLLSDSKWGIDVSPLAIPESTNADKILEVAGKVNRLLDFLWLDNRTQNKLAQVLQYVFLYGTGFIKCTFDPDNIGDGGIGQIETTVLSPYYIFVDPDASDIHDASYIIEHHPVSLRWVLERYPDVAEQVKESGEASETEYYERRGSTARGPKNARFGKSIDIYEFWYRDSSLVEDQDGPPVLKYPQGRHTLMTKGGIVLEDGECLYSMFPYIRFVDIPRPAQFFGDCTVHKALGIQDTINSLLRSIIDNGMWLVHGIWVADTTSGVTPKTLAGYGPRANIFKNPGTDVHRDSGEALPQHIFQTLEQQVEAFDRVVGLPDVLRGVVPSRQPVQTVMMQQESGEVRTRERQRRVEEALADLGQLWLDIVSNHWNDKRTISGKKALGGFDMFEISKADFEEWRWAVQVVPGSTAPMDRQGIISTLAEAVNTFGIQPPENYIVQLLGLPGLEQAMNEQLALQQEMDAEAAAGAGGEMNGNEAPPSMPTNPFGADIADPMTPPDIPEDGGMPDMSQLSPEEIQAIMASGGMAQLP